MTPHALQAEAAAKGVAIHYVTAGEEAALPSPPARLSQASALDAEELTILTSWAEALDDAPERVPALLSAAGQGDPWRAGLLLPEPAGPLGRGLDALRCLVTPDLAAGAPVRREGVDVLTERVLRYAIDARAARKARNVS